MSVSPDDFEELGILCPGSPGEETYLQLNGHGLVPGHYVATKGQDKNIELLPGSTTDKNYWGWDPAELSKSKHPERRPR